MVKASSLDVPPAAGVAPSDDGCGQRKLQIRPIKVVDYLGGEFEQKVVIKMVW